MPLPLPAENCLCLYPCCGSLNSIGHSESRTCERLTEYGYINCLGCSKETAARSEHFSSVSIYGSPEPDWEEEVFYGSEQIQKCQECKDYLVVLGICEECNIRIQELQNEYEAKKLLISACLLADLDGISALSKMASEYLFTAHYVCKLCVEH